jgi:hypothetical protein
LRPLLLTPEPVILFFQSKYEHLLGGEAALEASKVDSEENRSYGMVSAEAKKDRRTVEDIQKEIREGSGIQYIFGSTCSS